MRFSMSPDAGNVNRVNKLIVNPWTGPTYCGWHTCDELAREGWGVRTHEHPWRFRCSDVDQAGGLMGRHAHYNFCSDWCRDYWLGSSGLMAHETAARNGGKIFGMAAPGRKLGRYR